jgi:hypothetical protein
LFLLVCALSVSKTDRKIKLLAEFSQEIQQQVRRLIFMMTMQNFNQTAQREGFTTAVDAKLGLVLLKKNDVTIWAIDIHQDHVASQMAPLDDLNEAIEAEDLAQALAKTSLVDRYADIFDVFTLY